MSAQESDDDALIAQAIGGDRWSLEQLLLRHHDRLLASMARKMPSDLAGTVTAEDIAQEAYVVAFREVNSFENRGRDSFYRWLQKIAEHRLFDSIKTQRAAKRGGGRTALDGDIGGAGSEVLQLLDLLAAHSRTPSRVAAIDEATRAIQQALAKLADDYRVVLTMRFIEGKPVADVAAQMNRTEGAIHMLCHRALEQLRHAMGDSSAFFSRRS